MKIITNILNNIQCKRNNPAGLEATTLAKMFDLKFVGKPNRNNKDCEDYIDYRELNWKEVTEVYMYLSPVNFFGGVVQPQAPEIAMLVIKMWENGAKIRILAYDPKIKITNYVTAIRSKLPNSISAEKEVVFSNLLRDAEYLFPGKDIVKFWDSIYTQEFTHLDWFKEVFRDYPISDFLPIEDKESAFLYYGDNRGSYRQKQVRKFIPDNRSSLIISMKNHGLDNVNFKKKVKHSELKHHIDHSTTSLVIGDPEHEDNVITFRVYETLASSALAAIPRQFDPNMEIIQDEELKKVCYIDTKEDLVRLANSYSKDLINRQHEEFRRLIS